MQEAVDETGDWVAVSALAERYGVSRQAVWKRLANHRQKVPTRGERKSLRVHAPTYAQLVAETLDPAQELRNRNVKPSARRPDPSPEPIAIEPPPEPSRFNDAAAREKNAKAELAEMQLAEKRGELVPAREIEAAAIEAGAKIRQSVEAMRARAGQLYAASKGGEEAVQIELNFIVAATAGAIGDAMAALVSLAEERGAANGS